MSTKTNTMYNSSYLDNAERINTIERPILHQKLWFFLLYIIIVALLSSNYAAVNGSSLEEDASALLGIKSSLFDPEGALQSWNLQVNSSNSFCNWRGVFCGSNGRVNELRLPGLGLTGSLSGTKFAYCLLFLVLSSMP